MEWSGYMQDLSLLIQDSLVTFNDPDLPTELVDYSTSDAKQLPCSLDISSSTLADIMLLDEARPGKCLLNQQSGFEPSKSNNLNTNIPSSPTMPRPLPDDNNTMDHACLDEMPEAVVDQQGQLLSKAANSHMVMANPTLKTPLDCFENHNPNGSVVDPQVHVPLRSTTKVASFGESKPVMAGYFTGIEPVRYSLIPGLSGFYDKSRPGLVSPVADQNIDEADFTAHDVSNKNIASDSSANATVLTTRTTEGVIADLKRSRTTANQDPTKNLKTSHSSNTLSQQARVELTNLFPIGTSTTNCDNSPEGEGADEDEDDEDDDHETRPVTRPQKISQRKRRLNAIADSYMHDRMPKLAEKAILVTPEDEKNQSARWLVNQSENRQIISSPREYQTELFERAKEKNIIAVLDTGSGKTLIAVLLLRHIFAQELEDRALGKPKRLSFFVVDSVTLVFQQHAVLKANLNQPMDMFCGDMGTDLWNRKVWEKHFAENMVIVCTAEVLRQCLHHSFITINHINLLIFDEAHHAKKDHAYARIIKDFYSQAPPGSLLPKIFGMTASPVDARVDVNKAAAELEGILHCEIATAKDGSLSEFTVNSKQEQLAAYAPLGLRFETPLYSQMKARFKSNSVLRKPLHFGFEATRNLGAWCSDQVWPFCMAEEEAKKLLAKTERTHNRIKVQQSMEILEQNKALLQEAQQIVQAHNFESPDYNPMSLTSNNLSSKVVLLVQYIKERYERPTDDKCIIFVQQRYTAQLLAKLFSHPNIGTPNLHVGTLVGTRTGEAGDLNVSFREQLITMMNFRKGIINCLFATSVAEEGLDVPDCNLVIRFDLYTTLIQYIQSRGRARHANSRYVHMCEAGNQDHNQIILEVRRNEGILKRFCAALPEDRKLTGNDFNMDHFLAKERTHRYYTIKSTGAKLTYKISLLVLASFVDSLRHGSENCLRPEYIILPQGKQFICEVILPEESPVRGAIGRPASTKIVAKCSAAFETCLLLISGRYVDEHLLPVFKKQLPVMRNALLAVDSKKREAYDMKIKPKLWSIGGVPEKLFLTVLSLEKPESLNRASQPLALLTRSQLPQLPPFMLHFGGGIHSLIHCTVLAKHLSITLDTLTQINIFTLCLFDDVFSKEYESDVSKMPYFLVPISPLSKISHGSDPSELIAWDILRVVTEHHFKWSANPWDNKSWQTEPDEFFIDKFIVDPFDGSRKLWMVDVAPQFKPLDPVPPSSAPRTGTRKNNTNIMEYSCSLWAKARSRRALDPEQRVFKAMLVSLRRNLLDEFEGTDVETSKECYVILESLKISSIPTTVVAMAYLFPAAIHRIESYLIALEACQLLHLKIRPDLALEACTKDSDNSDNHSSQQINFQRGMGKNYERLEFLGDCFLKMATSISLYGIHPDNDEYRYHVDRMLLICNKNLYNNAVKLKLFEYIRSQSFSRRAWYPEGLVLKRGKKVAAPKSHKLGDKTIADVCEAIIGAALLTYHESKDMDNAVRAVTELVSSENHSVTRWADYYKLYNKPKYQTAVATEMQKNLAMQVEQKHAYHFRYPRLLRSCFVHPSYPFSYENIPSYQRLEFLGDSLLDMACVNFLYHNFPDKDPQWLTEHKMAMVSNQFLGALCVSLGFYIHLTLFNADYQKQITDYVFEVSEARRHAEEDALRAGKPRSDYSPDFWVSVRQPPKCLPDIVEAYIGAIFVDSEYKYSEVENFFDQHIKWYFNDMTIYDTFANKHPTTFLTKFLQVNMGCSDWCILTREVKAVDGSKPTVVAMVLVHGQVIAGYPAESSRYAKVGAANKALEILKGLPLIEYRDKYECECKPSDEDEIHGTAV